MKKRYLHFFFVALCFVNSLFASTNLDTQTRTIKEIAFESNQDSMVAYILLSDETVWHKMCTLEQAMLLQKWQSGDEVYITTDKNQGICLENIQTLTKIYASLSEETFELLPTIVAIEVVDGGWFSSTEYYIHLSDQTVWRVIRWATEMSPRWEIGQKTLVSLAWIKDIIINVMIPWDPLNPDDRSLFVEKHQ